MSLLRRDAVQDEKGPGSTQKCLQKSGLLCKLLTINHTGDLVTAMAYHGLNSPVKNDVNAATDLEKLLLIETLDYKKQQAVVQKLEDHTNAFMNSSSSTKRHWFSLEHLPQSVSKHKNKQPFLNTTLARITLVTCSQLCEFFQEKEGKEKNKCKYIIKTAKIMKDNANNPRKLSYFSYEGEEVSDLKNYDIHYIVRGRHKNKSFSIEMVSSAKLQTAVVDASRDNNQPVCEQFTIKKSAKAQHHDTHEDVASAVKMNSKLIATLQQMPLSQILTAAGYEPCARKLMKKSKGGDLHGSGLYGELVAYVSRQSFSPDQKTDLIELWKRCLNDFAESMFSRKRDISLSAQYIEQEHNHATSTYEKKAIKTTKKRKHEKSPEQNKMHRKRTRETIY